MSAATARTRSISGASRARRAAAARRAEVQRRVGMPTPREAEVFAGVVTGLLNKQIGAVLGIGEKAVKVHRSWRRCRPDRSPSWSGWQTRPA